MSSLNDNEKLKSNYITLAERATEGILFVAQERVTLSGGSSVDVGIKVPSGVNVVLGAFAIDTTSGDFSLEIFEGSAFTGGTMISLFNPNRTKDISQVSTSVLDPTVSDDGVLIGKLETLGDNANKSVGGLDNDIPMTLASDTDYIFRVTHNDINNKDFIIYFAGNAQNA